MLFALLLLITACLGSTFTITVFANGKDCVFERLEKNDRLEVSFEVMASNGDYEIDYVVFKFLPDLQPNKWCLTFAHKAKRFCVWIQRWNVRRPSNVF